MESVEVRIRGSLPADEVRRLLDKPDSGIKLAEEHQQENGGTDRADSGLGSFYREPRRSEVADVLALTGIIVNTAQLAVTIYQIFQAQRTKAQSGKPEPVQVQIVTAKGTLSVPATTSAEIEQSITQHVVNSK
jgi:hypothetical protein